MKIIEKRRVQYFFDKNKPEEIRLAAAAADGEVILLAEEGFNTTREHCTDCEIAEGGRQFEWGNKNNESELR